MASLTYKRLALDVAFHDWRRGQVSHMKVLIFPCPHSRLSIFTIKVFKNVQRGVCQNGYVQ